MVGRLLRETCQVCQTDVEEVRRKKYLTEKQLQTTLTEVEGVTNSRPITYVYNDCRDLDSPALLLIGR